MQLRMIEPGTVSLADIDNHAGAARKVDSPHYVGTTGTFPVADVWVRWTREVIQHLRRAEHRCLLVGILTDTLEGLSVQPHAQTRPAMVENTGPDLAPEHGPRALGTGEVPLSARPRNGRGPAGWTKLGVAEDSIEAFRTGYCGQLCSAVRAVGHLRAGWCST